MDWKEFPAQYPKNKTYKDGYATLCKRCNSDNASLSRKLRPLMSRARKYSITEEEIVKMYEQQKECAICGCSDKRLVIDHDHSTGKVRSLLCDLCNKGLGSFEDDIPSLQNAIYYLMAHGKY